MSSMKTKAIRLICTNEECPEQYDARDSDGNLVGYVRVRWGRCEAWCTAGSSEDRIVYSKRVRGWWNFNNALERWIHLRRVRRAMVKYWKGK